MVAHSVASTGSVAPPPRKKGKRPAVSERPVPGPRASAAAPPPAPVTPPSVHIDPLTQACFDAEDARVAREQEVEAAFRAHREAHPSGRAPDLSGSGAGTTDPGHFPAPGGCPRTRAPAAETDDQVRAMSTRLAALELECDHARAENERLRRDNHALRFGPGALCGSLNTSRGTPCSRPRASCPQRRDGKHTDDAAPECAAPPVRPRCGSTNTTTGRPCQNYLTTCRLRVHGGPHADGADPVARGGCCPAAAAAPGGSDTEDEGM